MVLHVTFSVVLAAAIFWVALADECPPEREQTLTHESKLHKDLLCDYNTDYRPVKDHKTEVTVKVRLALKYITFDTVEETFTIHSWVALRWKDEFLPWDPAQYGGIMETQLESHEIWTPRLALFNADATQYNTDTFYITCLVSHDGTVTCVPHMAHYAVCRSSLTRWPYDTQNCTLFFGSWMHTGEQVNFTFYQKQPVILDDYQNGPGWKLQNVVNKRLPGKYNNSTYPMLKYTFMLQREAAGPAALVVVPSVVIVFLTLTSLLLDVKDNTRLMLVCFSLFGHFTFLSEIGYNIPKHSADTPILLLFVKDSMIVTLAAILVTLLLMSLRRRVVPPPAWLVAMTRLATRGAARYVVFTDFDPNDVSDRKVLDDVTDAVGSEERASAASEWIQFANLLNSCVFIVTVFVYVVLIFCYIPYSNN